MGFIFSNKLPCPKNIQKQLVCRMQQSSVAAVIVPLQAPLRAAQYLFYARKCSGMARRGMRQQESGFRRAKASVLHAS